MVQNCSRGKDSAANFKEVPLFLGLAVMVAECFSFPRKRDCYNITFQPRIPLLPVYCIGILKV